jgi:hypothetical protein
MRKLMMILTLISLVMLFSVVSFARTVFPRVTINGALVKFPDTQAFINQDGRTMVPVRFVAENLGFDVQWEGSTRTVKISGRDSVLELVIESSSIKRNRSGALDALTMDTIPVIKDGRTMVPLRFISEAMGIEVNWNGANTEVMIVDPENDLTLEKSIELIPVYTEEEKKEVIEELNRQRETASGSERLRISKEISALERAEERNKERIENAKKMRYYEDGGFSFYGRLHSTSSARNIYYLENGTHLTVRNDNSVVTSSIEYDLVMNSYKISDDVLIEIEGLVKSKWGDDPIVDQISKKLWTRTLHLDETITRDVFVDEDGRDVALEGLRGGIVVLHYKLNYK